MPGVSINETGTLFLGRMEGGRYERLCNVSNVEMTLEPGYGTRSDVMTLTMDVDIPSGIAEELPDAEKYRRGNRLEETEDALADNGAIDDFLSEFQVNAEGW